MDRILYKGTYGYLDRSRIHAWKKAALMLAVPVLIFLGGWYVNGTRENVMTVVAIVGCLPGCNQVVRAIMASRYHSMDRRFYETVEKARGNCLALYENVFTSYEKTYYVDAVVLCGREIVGYSSDAKLDEKAAAEHIRSLLKKSSYKQNVTIYRNQNEFLVRVQSLSAEAEQPPFDGDDRYPDLTRDEIIRHLLMSISL